MEKKNSYLGTTLFILGLIFCVFVAGSQSQFATWELFFSLFCFLLLSILVFFLTRNLKSKLTVTSNAVVWIVMLIFTAIMVKYASAFSGTENVIWIACAVVLLLFSIVGFAITYSASKETTSNSCHLENVIGVVFLVPTLGYLAALISNIVSGSFFSDGIRTLVLPLLACGFVSASAFFAPRYLPISVLVLAAERIAFDSPDLFGFYSLSPILSITAIVFLLLACFDVWNGRVRFSICACAFELAIRLIAAFTYVTPAESAEVFVDIILAKTIIDLCYVLGFYFLGLSVKIGKKTKEENK